jgi:hypothetical protein
MAQSAAGTPERLGVGPRLLRLRTWFCGPAYRLKQRGTVPDVYTFDAEAALADLDSPEACWTARL